MTTDEAVHALDKTVKILEDPDLKGALRNVQEDLSTQLQNSFMDKVDPDGNAWDDRRRPYPWPLEIKTGDMYLAVIDAVSGAVIDKTTMELPPTTSLPFYAEFQDQGLEKINLPARPFLGFSQQTLDKALEHGVEEMNEQLMGAWQ